MPLAHKGVAHVGLDMEVGRIRGVLDQLGYRELVMKCDQENNIKALVEVIRETWRLGDITVEMPPVGEKPANGAIEKAVQSLEGMVRTIKLALECKIRTKIPADHPVLTWMVEHSGLLLRRYRVCEDGRTAFEKMRGRRVNRSMAAFGEQIFYRLLRPHGARASAMGERFLEGTFIGVIDATDEVIVATPEGGVWCGHGR